MPGEEKMEEIRVDRKSKILFVVLGILIIGSVSATFWRYIIKRDYIIQAQIDCNPETENCFVWRCDPLSLQEGEACTGVLDKDIWYYKIFRRNARNIPSCNPKDENCTAYQCQPGEKECEIIDCDPENVGKDEECSTPEQYLLENPPEEKLRCDEKDEDCLNDKNKECQDENGNCLKKNEEGCQNENCEETNTE